MNHSLYEFARDVLQTLTCQEKQAVALNDFDGNGNSIIHRF